MSGKSAKKIKRAIRKYHKIQWDEMYDLMCDQDLKTRIRMAWRIIMRSDRNADK